MATDILTPEQDELFKRIREHCENMHSFFDLAVECGQLI
jgi:hypothetical protein